MKFEFALDKPALMETIRQVYGYPVSTLTFVPEGMVGCHYIADCADGKRTFVTLLTDNHMAALQTRRLDFTLALISNLYERGLFTAQPAVCRALDGRLKADFQGQPLVLYEYIPGDNLGEEARPYPPEVLTGLGRLAAQLHCASAEVGMEVPFIEQFDLPFEQPLLERLAELEQIKDDARPGKVELRELILPRREILRTPQGELFIVDWEGVLLGPAEFDLFIFAGEGFPTLLTEYYRCAGKPRLHPELFGYYFFRRNLEDLTEFIIRIMQENTTAEENRYELDLLTSDCLANWPFLENGVEWAREQIRAA